MKNKIYLKHWLALKPNDYSSKTDLYYLKVANKVHSNFSDEMILILSQYLSTDERFLLCSFLTCYFEDIISDTNLWFTIKKINKELYNKTLPFYEIEEDYIDDEINYEDIAFLVWYFLNTIQDSKFINPHNDFIFEIAILTMQVLEEEYEYAPENTELKKIFEFKNNDEKLYSTRAFIQTIFFESYLFYTDIQYQFDLEQLNIINDNEGENPSLLVSYVREITEDFTFNKVSALFALKAKEWAEYLLGEKHVYYKSTSSISNKISGLFLYKSQNENFVNLEHIASGLFFEMTKESFDHYENLKEDDILYIGLVKYEGEWWFSGNFSASDFNADVILDQKNSAEARSETHSLRDHSMVNTILKKQEKAFLKFNNNSHIAFMEANKVESFISRAVENYNQSLNLSSKDIEDSKQNVRNDGFFGFENDIDAFDSEDIAVVFFNPKKGLEIGLYIENAFPDKNNAFYSDESNEDIMSLLISPDYSTELVYYFIDNYKDKLDFFKQPQNELLLKDIDFLLRFWKKDDYITESGLLTIGKD